MKRRARIGLVMAVLVCLMLSGIARAEIDDKRMCTLQIQLGEWDGTAAGSYPSMRLSVYRVGDIKETTPGKAAYTARDAFADSGIDLNGLSLASTAQAAAKALLDHALHKGVSPDATGVTNAGGAARFADLPTGLYLIEAAAADAQVVSAPFLVSMPTYVEAKYWDYMPTAQLKLETVHGALLVQKVGGKGEVLAGAVFKLMKRDGQGRYQEYRTGLVTDRSGQLALEGLEVGSYRLIETRAPEGYILDDSARDFVISEMGALKLVNGRYVPGTGQVIELRFVNEALPAPSPEPSPTVTVTPTPTPGETTRVTGRKIWEDDDNAAGVRPGSITVTLYANGEATNRRAVWGNTESSIWSYAFNNLPLNDEAGNRITYTVQEQPVPYYETQYDGTDIINRLLPGEVNLIDIHGQKTWVDDENADGARPQRITVRLLRDGEVVQTRTVTAEDGWRYSFTDLPDGDGYGRQYTYTVREDHVPGYYGRVRGYDIVNTRVPMEWETPGRPRTPQYASYTEEELEDLVTIFDNPIPLWGGLLPTGDETPVYPFVFGGIGAMAVILAVVLARKRRRASGGRGSR